MQCIVRVLGFGVSETILKLKIWPAINREYIADPQYSIEAYETEYKRLLKKLPDNEGIAGASLMYETGLVSMERIGD
ncbi:MAG: hypothetical protein PHF56_24895 [Desulfuromonadaceae bacterium]|nr:hypothetical protein [Desulfuromonadaceae bacterium]